MDDDTEREDESIGGMTMLCSPVTARSAVSSHAAAHHLTAQLAFPVFIPTLRKRRFNEIVRRTWSVASHS
jgi:hypothetical protein